MLGLKSMHFIVHGSDDTAPTLKLQVEQIQVARDVTQKLLL